MTLYDDDLARVTGGAPSPGKMLELAYREAGWVERMIRGYRYYRETAPALGKWTAIRWALKDTDYPLLIPK